MDIGIWILDTGLAMGQKGGAGLGHSTWAALFEAFPLFGILSGVVWLGRLGYTTIPLGLSTFFVLGFYLSLFFALPNSLSLFSL
jgi:hypothetical protein